MIAVISPANIEGTITVPASKSAMQRACALALLHNGTTTIQNPGKSNDDLAAINIIQDLGTRIKYENADLILTSTGIIKHAAAVYCRESGLSLRMFAPIASLSEKEITLNGEGSLLKRPMDFFNEILPRLGVHVSDHNGYLPITVKGPLTPADIIIDGSMSSQYLTGLLFAFAKSSRGPVTITVNNLKSKPYIDLSLRMLAHFGYSVRHFNYENFFIEPVEQAQRNITYHTEGDWSAASFLLVAGALAGNLKVKGLDIYSAQADLAIMDVLQSTGANIRVEGSCVLVNNEKPLRSFQFDANDSPDLFPPLVALAAHCKGTSVIKGVSRLAGKESDRSRSLTDVFTKMGISVILNADNMIIEGKGIVRSADISSHYDHRVAMACAVAALGADGPVTIRHAEAVNKSYPDFYEHLQMLGATVSLQE